MKIDFLFNYWHALTKKLHSKHEGKVHQRANSIWQPRPSPITSPTPPTENSNIRTGIDT